MAKLRTIGSVLDSVKRRFKDRGIESYRLDAELLLAEVLGCQRIDLYLNLSRPLAQEELKAYRKLVEARVRYCPVAYLLGQKEFMSLEFRVEEGVFIPRPDSEVLIEYAIDKISSFLPTQIKIADLCAGTGCLGISLAYYLEQQEKEVRVDFYEKESRAISVLEENALKYLKSGRFHIYSRDILKEKLSQKYDLIISNPPYISVDEWETLAPEVRDYHLRETLTDGSDGLNYYRYFASALGEYLEDNGYLIVEIGWKQREDVEDIFQKYSFWEKVDVIKDLGKRDRGLVWKKK